MGIVSDAEQAYYSITEKGTAAIVIAAVPFYLTNYEY